MRSVLNSFCQEQKANAAVLGKWHEGKGVCELAREVSGLLCQTFISPGMPR